MITDTNHKFCYSVNKRNKQGIIVTLVGFHVIF